MAMHRLKDFITLTARHQPQAHGSRRRVNLFMLAGIIYVLGLPGIAARGEDDSDRQRDLNGGYFLLHELCGQEADLPLLLDIKHAPPDIKDLATRISQAAKETNARIEEMQARDAKLRYDQNPLPPIERDVRKSIQDEKQHQLLFGTSNAAFVRALLVAQLEATSYAGNIAKVLSSEEGDSRRGRSLDKISTKWSALHDECFHRLAMAP